MLCCQRTVVSCIRAGFRPLQPLARGSDHPLLDFPTELPSAAGLPRVRWSAAPVAPPPGERKLNTLAHIQLQAHQCILQQPPLRLSRLPKTRTCHSFRTSFQTTTEHPPRQCLVALLRMTVDRSVRSRLPILRRSRWSAPLCCNLPRRPPPLPSCSIIRAAMLHTLRPPVIRMLPARCSSPPLLAPPGVWRANRPTRPGECGPTTAARLHLVPPCGVRQTF